MNQEPGTKKSRQITDTILMVRPAHFGYNEETAESNAFQRLDESRAPESIREQARREFDDFVEKLRRAGVEVIVVEDQPVPVRPDAVFPNNWVTFHDDGVIVTYPMHSPIRRRERREDVLQQFAGRFGFRERLRLEENEARNRFLEGTGSMILDREHRLAYACLSPRTDLGLLDEFCRRMGYEKVAFTAVDGNGKEIYHTNVMMALGETFVIVCLDAVPDPAEHEELRRRFAETKKEVIGISLDQMMAFAGNMLQLSSKDGLPYLVMSEQAFRSLSREQINRIQQHTRILYSPLYTIETYGGGSARCMMAEVFPPQLG